MLFAIHVLLLPNIYHVAICVNCVCLGTAVEDLTTVTSSELLDVEDEVSTPVTMATNNGNAEVNPAREQTTFISNQTNGVM